MNFQRLMANFALGTTLAGAVAALPPTALAQDTFRIQPGKLPLSFDGCTTNDYGLHATVEFASNDDYLTLARAHPDEIADAWTNALLSDNAAVMTDPAMPQDKRSAASDALWHGLWDQMHRAARMISTRSMMDLRFDFVTVTVNGNNNDCRERKHDAPKNEIATGAALFNANSSEPFAYGTQASAISLDACTLNDRRLVGAIPTEVSEIDLNKFKTANPNMTEDQIIDAIEAPFRIGLQAYFDGLAKEPEATQLTLPDAPGETRAAARAKLAGQLDAEKQVFFYYVGKTGLHLRAGAPAIVMLTEQGAGCEQRRKIEQIQP